jgi:acid phosphatase family membrane protein YuiD
MIIESFTSLFDNPIFLASISTFVLSQCIKSLLSLFKMRERKGTGAIIALTWSTGGMPSSHSALVAAMATSAAFAEGLGSNVFVITFFFAMVIIRDALGVRRATGLQAKALNRLGRDVAARFKTDWECVKEIQGHSPFEVGVGIALGIVVACAFRFLLLL